MLDLAIKQHDDDDMLREFVDAIQKQLKKYKSQCHSCVPLLTAMLSLYQSCPTLNTIWKKIGRYLRLYYY